ncbi:hypothetical protein [Cupriavidus plantarum]|uniref:hypothetical protein n=1 Tax=Cupriavidus plantarum TaxID=942865 RepID=UPI00339D344E
MKSVSSTTSVDSSPRTNLRGFFLPIFPGIGVQAADHSAFFASAPWAHSLAPFLPSFCVTCPKVGAKPHNREANSSKSPVLLRRNNRSITFKSMQSSYFSAFPPSLLDH